MAFVNELIPEEKKDNISFPVSTRPDGSKPTLWKWTIDREKKACLVFAYAEGGGYEGTQVTKHFVLNWDGNLINMSADPLPPIRNKSGVVMTWRLHQLRIPFVLQSQKKEVLQLIKEAFTTMGDLYDGENYAAVNVEFDSSTSSS